MWAAVLILMGVLSSIATAETTEDEIGLRREFRGLVGAGRDADAMRLMCRMKVVGVACGFDPELAYLEDVERLWHRRYEAVFSPPGNADSMSSGSWAHVTPASRYNRDGVAAIGSASGGGIARYVRATMGGKPERTFPDASASPAYLVVQYAEKPYATVDLDLDGRPDATFDGTVALLSPDLNMVVDDARDGERFQWRIGPKGSDVQDRPRIWIYRDGCYFNLFLDTDGNGWGNCGGGGRFPVGDR